MAELIPVLNDDGCVVESIDVGKARLLWSSFILNAELFHLANGDCLWVDTSYRSFPPIKSARRMTPRGAANEIIRSNEAVPVELLRVLQSDGDDDEAAAALSVPRQAAQPLATNDYRALFDLGRSITPALDVLCTAVGELFDDFLGGIFIGCAGKPLPTIGAAALQLTELIPPELSGDANWFIERPPLADSFVNVVSDVAAFAEQLLIDLDGTRASGESYWQSAFKRLHQFQVQLDSAMRKLESAPELRSAIRRRVQERIKAAQQREAANAQLSPDEEYELLYGEPATDQAWRPAEAAPVEAPASEAATVQAAAVEAVELTARQTSLMLAGRVPVAPATVDELAAAFAPSQLAERFGLKLTTLNKALERWRAKHDDGWHEVENRKPREPKYLYRLSAVMPLINELLAASSEVGASSELSA